MNNAELIQWIREQIAELHFLCPEDEEDEAENRYQYGAKDAYEHVIQRILYEDRRKTG